MVNGLHLLNAFTDPIGHQRPFTHSFIQWRQCQPCTQHFGSS